MSSPPEETEEKKTPGWRQPWDPWRILMFTGSMILLGLAFARLGGEDRLPQWLMIGLYAIGFGLLAYGFALAMRTKKEILAQRAQEEKKRKKKVSPRDPG
ncbi:MAG: NADH-quinone oxidoreductase subunit K [Actinobacteria bacterium]|nr:NADH-quinone oxidoreductase subunit K [Actinomycetota bacterium]